MMVVSEFLWAKHSSYIYHYITCVQYSLIPRSKQQPKLYYHMNKITTNFADTNIKDF